MNVSIPFLVITSSHALFRHVLTVPISGKRLNYLGEEAASAGNW